MLVILFVLMLTVAFVAGFFYSNKVASYILAVITVILMLPFLHLGSAKGAAIQDSCSAGDLACRDTGVVVAVVIIGGVAVAAGFAALVGAGIQERYLTPTVGSRKKRSR